MAETTGLAAIVADAGAGETLADQLEPAEQLTMAGLEAPRAAARGAGRPAGRRNLRNQRIADYLLSKYPDVLEALVATATLPVDSIVEATGCNRFEALQEKRLCAVAALPYIHQRQAIAVDTTNRSIVHLTINDQVPGAMVASTAAPIIAGELADLVAIAVADDNDATGCGGG